MFNLFEEFDRELRDTARRMCADLKVEVHWEPNLELSHGDISTAACRTLAINTKCSADEIAASLFKKAPQAMQQYLTVEREFISFSFPTVESMHKAAGAYVLPCELPGRMMIVVLPSREPKSIDAYLRFVAAAFMHASLAGQAGVQVTLVAGATVAIHEKLASRQECMESIPEMVESISRCSVEEAIRLSGQIEPEIHRRHFWSFPDTAPYIRSTLARLYDTKNWEVSFDGARADWYGLTGRQLFDFWVRLDNSHRLQLLRYLASPVPVVDLDCEASMEQSRDNTDWSCKRLLERYNRSPLRIVDELEGGALGCEPLLRRVATSAFFHHALRNLAVRDGAVVSFMGRLREFVADTEALLNRSHETSTARERIALAASDQISASVRELLISMISGYRS